MPKTPRVAVLSNDALGNYVVVTPLLQMLRERLRPDELHYFGGARTEELWRHDESIDWGYPLFGTAPATAIRDSFAVAGDNPYDLIVNVEMSDWAKGFVAAIATERTFVVGPSIGPEGRADLPFADDPVGKLATDPAWTASDLAERYSILKTGFIGEIFCRLAYLDGQVPRYRLVRQTPSIDIPDVLISTSASLGDKLWPLESWLSVVSRLRMGGWSVGVVGAKPSEQRRFWRGDDTETQLIEQGRVIDLRGQISLPEVVGALGAAKLVLTIDNGILHMACATSTPVVGLFREGIHRLWAPPVPNLSVLTPAVGERVSSLSTETVWEAVTCALNGC